MSREHECLLRIEHKLDRLMKGIIRMKQEILDKFAQLDEATNVLASQVSALKVQVQACGVTDPEVLASFDTAIAKLKGLAADPENPVPEAPPVEPPAP